MSLFEKLIFLPLDIPNPPDCTKYWDTLTEQDLYVDDYRTCHHIPIMTGDGQWTQIAEQTPQLINWFEQYVFTWAERSRVMIIRTEPQKENAPHIDCSPQKFNTLQHKLRYVFQGKVDSLYFIHNKGQERPKEIDACYMMSGRWPHAMNNYTNNRKYTLALGAPWEPDPNEPKYADILNKSYHKYKNYYIGHHDWSLPSNWRDLFENKYIVDSNVRFENTEGMITWC